MINRRTAIAGALAAAVLPAIPAIPECEQVKPGPQHITWSLYDIGKYNFPHIYKSCPDPYFTDEGLYVNALVAVWITDTFSTFIPLHSVVPGEIPEIRKAVEKEYFRNNNEPPELAVEIWNGDTAGFLLV